MPQTRSSTELNSRVRHIVDPTENVIALTNAATKRHDDLRDLNDRRLDAAVVYLEKIAELRAEHAKESAAAESSRLNAIRQFDALAVNTAADRALQAIQALDKTTATNAENLRNALTSTAQTIATQTANTVTAITERISALEKASYKGEGKQTGMSASWGLLLGIVALISTLIAIGTFLFGAHASAPATPQIIYLPATTAAPAAH